MTIILSEQQAALYEAWWESARHIEDDCLELAERRQMDGPVTIETMDGTVLFALTPRRR